MCFLRWMDLMSTAPCAEKKTCGRYWWHPPTRQKRSPQVPGKRLFVPCTNWFESEPRQGWKFHVIRGVMIYARVWFGPRRQAENPRGVQVQNTASGCSTHSDFTVIRRKPFWSLHSVVGISARLSAAQTFSDELWESRLWGFGGFSP